jgi:hypothetical protein
MLRKWFDLSSYHWLVLFAAMAASGAFLAWMTVGLVEVAMANYDFLRTYGSMAVLDGGLVQLVLIGAKALVALVAYLSFKAIEVELVHRWRGR